MGRRLRLIALLIVAIVVVGVVALVLTSRPKLSDERTEVDEAWTPLRAPLQQRYAALAAVLTALEQVPGDERDVAEELGSELGRWNDLIQQSDDDADAEAEAETANALEDLGERLRVSIASSTTLSGNEALGAALATFQADVPPADAVTTYNDAVEQYEKTRDGSLRRYVASVFGYESRPTLVIGGTTPPA
jgi:hypothetical protein